MKFLSFLDALGAADAQPAATPRRGLLRQLGQASARAAAAALPLSLATPAAAAPTDTFLDAIQVVLQLEDLLVAFYTQALAAPVLNGGAGSGVRADFVRILRHQQDHAQFLRNSITLAGITPPAAPAASSYDFSGRRNNASNPELFPNVLTDYSAFLQLAQQLEDASASVYLGQATYFTGDRQLFDAIVRMQLVEARHASHVRTLRRNAPMPVAVKSWVSGADTAPTAPILVPSPASATAPALSIYTFEANESQAVTAADPIPFPTILTNTTAVQFRALAESFDEPLPTRQAVALFNIFR